MKPFFSIVGLAILLIPLFPLLGSMLSLAGLAHLDGESARESAGTVVRGVLVLYGLCRLFRTTGPRRGGRRRGLSTEMAFSLDAGIGDCLVVLLSGRFNGWTRVDRLRGI